MKQAKPGRRFNLYLIALVMFNFLPHLSEQSPLVFILAFFCLIWRVLYEFQKVKLPGKIIKTLLVAFSLAMIYQVNGSLDGTVSVSGILLCGAALKMLDNVNYRDAMVLLFVNFMLLMSSFLIDQSLLLTLFGALDLILISSLLFQLHKAKDLAFNFWSMTKLGAKLCAMTMPLLVLMFIVFPRFTVGVFNNKSQNDVGSGFSDSIEPGGVDRLVLDNTTAFRVYFKGKAPRSSEMYWRGISFDTTDGLKWSGKPKYERYNRQFNVSSKQQDYSYEVVLEPNYGKWLFLLDPKRSFSLPHWRYYRNIEEGDDGSLRLKNAVAQNVLYRGSSHDIPQKVQIDKERFLQLPEQVSPKIVALAKELSKEKENINVFVNNAKEYFTANFAYSLNLPKKSSNDIEKFLFEERIGFCEHFAASFAYLARLSGIPSRVVAGFQGGRKHPYADYVIVSNRDAHAWVELYDDELGVWQRIDPTSFVAPLRIELGGQLFHSVNESVVKDVRDAKSFIALVNGTGWQKSLESIRLAVDVIQERWNYFLISYDYDQQKELLKSLGLNIKKRSQLAWLALGFFMAFLLWLRFRQMKSLNQGLSKIQKLVQKQNKSLSQLGYQKSSAQGYLDFYKMLAKDPEIRKESTQYSRLLANYLYAGHAFGRNEEKELKRIFSALLLAIKSKSKTSF